MMTDPTSALLVTANQLLACALRQELYLGSIYAMNLFSVGKIDGETLDYILSKTADDLKFNLIISKGD